MSRFGKLFAGFLLLAVIGFLSLVRCSDIRMAPEPDVPSSDAVGPSGLIVPVGGVASNALSDSFADARDDRAHGALDIMAPRGTPVIAAAPGKVEKIFESAAGGHTVYVRSGDGRFVYYYAHLDSYAPGLTEGQTLARGAAIGRVGFTGNASPDGPHLHFAIMAMAPGEAWHEGRPINPYPLLAGAGRAR